MKRFKAIMRETWWVWLVIFGGGIFASLMVSLIFLSSIPIGIFAFVYFALMRYDDNGLPRNHG